MLMIGAALHLVYLELGRGDDTDIDGDVDALRIEYDPPIAKRYCARCATHGNDVPATGRIF